MENEDDPITKHYRYHKVSAVFDRLDVGGNGSICLAEYLTQIEKLTPDEVAAARAAFEMLGPDKDGNVRKIKYIRMQIEAFEDVLDPEFERWVNIMTTGSTVHSHTKKALLAAGVEIPDDYIEPPGFNPLRIACSAIQGTLRRAYNVVFADSEKRRVAAFTLSAEIRQKHIKKVQNLRYKLQVYDKTLLDEQDAYAISQLQERTLKKGTLLPPRTPPKQANEPGQGTKKKRRRGHNRNDAYNEEKQMDEGPKRGLKEGCEFAPLMYESSELRLRRARELEKESVERRLTGDLYTGRSGTARDTTRTSSADGTARITFTGRDTGRTSTTRSTGRVQIEERPQIVQY